MNKFQQLVDKILKEDVSGNVAGSGGVFGIATDFNDVDTKYLMATALPNSKSKKKKKKSKFPKIIRRTLPSKTL
jgi:hypothetical protein